MKGTSTVLISKHRYYVTADKLTAVKAGEDGADTLLVGKGAAVLPEVAEYYGLETEDGESVLKVEKTLGEQAEAAQTQGATYKEIENFDRVAATREAYDETNVSRLDPHLNAASGQGAILAAAKVNVRFGARDALGRPIDAKAERIANRREAKTRRQIAESSAPQTDSAGAANVSQSKSKQIGAKTPSDPNKGQAEDGKNKTSGNV